MKKKLFALVLASVMAVSMTACGESKSVSDNSGSAKSDSAGSSKGVKVIDIDLTNEEYAFGVDKDQEELLTQVNDFIGKIKEDGTLDDICQKYFGGGEPTAVKSAQLILQKTSLLLQQTQHLSHLSIQRVKITTVSIWKSPMLADELGQELVIQNMDFDAVCLSVGQHKCDIAMAGLTVNEERQEYVNFSDTYYQASQRLIVKADDTTFDDCKEAADVEALLQKTTSSDKIGVQAGTTAQYYIEGSDDWDFAGLPAECVQYKNGSLAVQDLVNGNLKYVIIDAAPAACITEAINAMQ